jgi:hypothetical protein
MSRIWWKAVHGKDAEPPGPHRHPIKVDDDD